MARFLSLSFLLAAFSAFSTADGTKEFVSLVEKICQTPCGVDARKDQEERQWVIDWMKRYELSSEEKRSLLVREICEWMKTDAKAKPPKLTEEKKNFVLARMKEKKSPLSAIFCSAKP